MITLNNKPAIKIKAIEEWKSDRAVLYNCEGDKKWISREFSLYNEKEQTLIIEEWLYNKIFK